MAVRSETRVGREVVALRPAGNLRRRPLALSNVRSPRRLLGQTAGRRSRRHPPGDPPSTRGNRGPPVAGPRLDAGHAGRPGADTEEVVARWIEAACLALTSQPDPVLARQVDELVDQFVRAQQPDGYVGAYHTVREPGKRFTNLRDMGELSAAGQILRAASAHHEATGEFRFLNVALRYVDLVGSVFGSGEHQKHGYPGYPGIETALVDHYRSTGERRYLELSRYFVDQRGQQPNYFELEAIDRGESLTDDAQRRSPSGFQAHVPVWQQTTAGCGHAGRAVSLYAAMVDVGIETDDATLIRAAEKLFESVSERRVYVTGGIGSSRENGAFTADFDLPNETADASTRSAIGLFEWLDRMSHLGTDFLATRT